MSDPERKTVELDEFACTANTDEEVEIDASTTVSTFGKVVSVSVRGDTEYRWLIYDSL